MRPTARGELRFGEIRNLGPGDVVGEYVLDQIVGRGGMGVVYRARQRRPERVVAIKLIAPELAADPAFRARFEQESANAAEIEHPNVIPVYGVGDEDGILFLAMRFVQGVDLGGLLAERGRLAPTQAAHLISQVAEALDAAHSHGLVHRDVKPGNILIATGDHVYLTDFGLTKRTADTRGMTRTGQVVGTVAYMAPEQIEGGRIDARTDEYALACVTHEALSGAVPFERGSEVATLFAHVNEPPPRLQDVPAPLADAVQRGLSKRPQDRFPSAGDFGRAVLAGAAGNTATEAERAVATGEATIADRDAPTQLAFGPVSPSTQHRRDEKQPPLIQPSHRRRWQLLALLAVLAALAATGTGLTLALNNHTTTRHRTRPRVSSTPTATTTPTATRIFNPVSASGGLAVSITRQTRGSCFTGSLVAGRSDAWRCTVDNTLLDPCFTANDQRQVVCPTTGPWTNKGVLVRVIGGLPSGLADKNTGTSGQPWAVQLANGEQCTAVGGATSEVAGQRQSFTCTNGQALYGGVRRGKSVWEIWVGGRNSAQLTSVAIAIAWY